MQNMNHLVSLLQEGYTTVVVVFGKQSIDAPWVPDAGGYTYKCPLMLGVKAGDLVVVPGNQGKLPSVATVVEVHTEPELKFESNIEYKWLIDKVDFNIYNDTCSKEQKIMAMLRENERKKQRAALLEHYQLSLPDGGDERKIFDQVRQVGLPLTKE